MMSPLPMTADIRLRFVSPKCSASPRTSYACNRYAKYFGKNNMTANIQNQKPACLGLACYRHDQWQQLLATAEDSEDLESTWEEWRENANNFINKLKANGIHVEEVLIDVNDLNEYCHIHNLPNNAETRSEYVTRLLQRSE